MSEESEQYRPTENEPDQEWTAAYLGCFGRRMEDEEAAAIETECNNVFRGSLKAFEMTKAVRYCAINSPTGGRKYAPNGEEIIRAIKALRANYHKLKHHTSYIGHACQMGYGFEHVEAWMRLLKEALTEDERWNIICRPYDEKHCQQREKFCRDNSLPYAKYDLIPA